MSSPEPARAEEILSVNIEDLDLAARRCPVKAEGTRSRGQAHEDFVLETARTPTWLDSPTARPAPCSTSTPPCAGWGARYLATSAGTCRGSGMNRPK